MLLIYVLYFDTEHIIEMFALFIFVIKYPIFQYDNYLL